MRRFTVSRCFVTQKFVLIYVGYLLFTSQVLATFPLLVAVVALDHFLPDDETVGLGELARLKLASTPREN